MASDIAKLNNRLNAFNVSLDELEAQLEPLFSQTLPETVVSLETIQQAKLQVAIPYLVHGLTFAYLKTQGIDPKTHPVVTELERVRQYFEKIKEAEDPEKRRSVVDKGAATRFIQHAIRQATSAPLTPPIPAGPSTHIRFDDEGNPQRVPAKVTDKMRERERYEKELKEQGSDEEEEELEVFEGDEEAEPPKEEPVTKAKKRKDKGKSKPDDLTPPIEEVTAGKKRRRPAADVFAGYEGLSTPTREQSAAESSAPTTDMESAAPSSVAPISKERKKRKKSKATASDS